MLSFKFEFMKKYLFIIIFQCSFLVTNYAQVKVNSISSVGIGTDTISQSAKLEVHSNSKGFLKPRLTASARLAISNKVPGLEVYDVDSLRTYWWDGTDWKSCKVGSGSGDILQNGNSFGTSFIIGSNDNQTTNLEANNKIAVSIDPSQVTSFKRDNTAVNSLEESIILDANSTGTPTTGFGPLLKLKAKSNTTASREQASIGSKWVVATDASREAALSFGLGKSGGSLQEVLKLDRTNSGGTGLLTLGTSSPVGITASSLAANQAFTISNSSNNNINLTAAGTGIFNLTGAANYQLTAITTNSYVADLRAAQSATGIGNEAAVFYSNTNNTTNNGFAFYFRDASIAGASAGVGCRFNNQTSHYGDLYFSTRSSSGFSTKLWINADGKISLGPSRTTPTAWLDLNPGSTAANSAPLKFTSGSLLTTPEGGSMEFLNDRLYFTKNTPSVTRETILYQSDAVGDKGDITVTNASNVLTFTIDPDAVTSSKILDGTIATADVANDAITFAKIQNINTSKILGRSTAGTGDVEEISIGTGLSLSSGVLSTTNLSGSGSYNYLSKWTTNPTGTTLGNSQIVDDGTTVSIGTTNANSKFHVGGRIGQNFGAGSQLNIAIGNDAGNTATTGSDNIFFGISSGIANTSGSGNLFFGKSSGDHNTIGTDNVFIGRESGRVNLDGNQNTIIGTASASNNTSGTNNLIMGAYSGNQNTEGQMNVILGAYSGRTNTTGSYNIMIGPQNYTGASNTGSSNIFIGSDAGITNTSAGSNIFIGTETGKYNSTGGSNLFIGHSAGKSNTTAYYNTFAGILAGGNNTEGAKNVCLGYNAGTTITTGSENTLIGYYADISSNNQTNSAAFGNGAVSQASNKIRVGNAAVTEIGGQVGWTTISDKRFKSNIKDDVPGLEFIKKLKPVTYFVDTRMITENLIRNMHDTIKAIYRKTDFNESSNIKRTGFLAQDVEGTCQEIGYDFDGVNIPKDKEDLYSLSYAQFVVPLVKAVQEQELKIEALNLEISNQKLINEEKDRQLNDLLKRIEIIELKLK